MIFSSKNEAGEPAYELIARGVKTVTRRLKPKRVGSIMAVQPARATKAVCVCGHLFDRHFPRTPNLEGKLICGETKCDCPNYTPLRVRVKLSPSSCMTHEEWLEKLEVFLNSYEDDEDENYSEAREEQFFFEAKREGFESWRGLLDWFKAHEIDINDTYRIEFEVLKE